LRKQLPQFHSCQGPFIGAILQFRKNFLRGTDSPTFLFRQRFNRNPLFIERTDVAQGNAPSVFIVFNPMQGQSLRAAYVWTAIVNPARALLIKKSAGARGMRDGFFKERGVMKPDIVRFHLENRKVINAAGAASLSALQPRAVKPYKFTNLVVDVSVELIKGLKGYRRRRELVEHND